MGKQGEVVDLTVDSDEEEEELELLGYISESIVGIQYYDGEVNKNEMVVLTREPHNPYDEWAVRVDNVRGSKVGHLPRKLVCHLAPLIDRGVLEIEGLAPGSSGVYKTPCQVYLYVTPGAERQVMAALRAANKTLYDPETHRPVGGAPAGPARGGASSSAAARAEAAAQAVGRLTPQEMESSINNLFEELLKEGQGEPERLHASAEVTADLYPHQQEALAWMVRRENSNGLPPLWEPALGGDGRLRYVSTLTNFASPERPPPLRGGILADDMGLGKTLQMVALVATNHPGVTAAGLRFEHGAGSSGAGPSGTGGAAAAAAAAVAGDGGEEEPPHKKQKADAKGKGKGKGKGKAAAGGGGGAGGQAAEAARLAAAADGAVRLPAAGGPRSTLLVCPLSVLSNWQSQVEEHTAGNLKVYTYHGANRNRKPSFLAAHDIVLTTYSTLASDAGTRGGGGLLKVDWLRVILDEAHTIKNSKTLTAKAAQALRAERRWAVTGTPIQNSLMDLQGLTAFLRLEPASDRSLFLRSIERPIKNRDPLGLKRLQVLMGGIALRRTKQQRRGGVPLVSLPARRVSTLTVSLDAATRAKYRKWEEAGQRIVGAHLAASTLLQNYTAILEIILRLRQICCHAGLVPQEDPTFSAQLQAPSAALTPEAQAALVALLKAGLEEDCPVCLSPPDPPCITICKHIFCRRCIETVIARDKPSCPMCRGPVRAADLVELPEAEAEEAEAQAGPAAAAAAAGGVGASAKIAALVARLKADEAAAAEGGGPPVKSCVFSQFVGFLDLVEPALKEEGFNCLRLDGRTPAAQRGPLLRAFGSKEAGSPTVLLVSLKAGGTGLNMVSASRVHMLDQWWNPAVEEQAMDRVHRLGQTRDVQVYRYCCKGTIEERILELQEVKRELMKAAFDRRSAQDVRNMRLRDVRLLMAME